MNRAVCWNSRKLLRNHNGSIEAAQFIHESAVFCLRAAPYPAFPDFIHVLHFHFASVRNTLSEPRIRFLKHFLE